MFIENEGEDPLKKYFKYTWKQTEIDNHVVEEIKNVKSVIDVGCGFNQYKRFNKNLVGIDYANNKADWVGDLVYYKTNTKFEVAICYGVLHFYSYDWIRRRLEWVINNTSKNAKILMKVNPNNPRADAPDLVWFDKWNRGLVEHFAEIYDLSISNWREWKTPTDDGFRIKFDYKKIEGK